MTESDKKKLLVVGKILNPRCFKNLLKEKLQVYCHANKNILVTLNIFSNWLEKLQAKFRSIFLLINNCAAHPKNIELKNITLET